MKYLGTRLCSLVPRPLSGVGPGDEAKDYVATHSIPVLHVNLYVRVKNYIGIKGVERELHDLIAHDFFTHNQVQ